MLKKLPFLVVALIFCATALGDNDIFVTVPDANENPQWNITNIRAVHFEDQSYNFIANDGITLFTGDYSNNPLWIFTDSISLINMTDNIENSNQDMMLVYLDQNNVEIIMNEELSGAALILVYDLQGKLCINDIQDNTSQFVLNTGILANGMYQVCVITTNKTYVSKYIKH